MDDLISRQAAIDAVKGRFSMPVDNLIVEVIGKLPTAEPKTGHWMWSVDEYGESWLCSECLSEYVGEEGISTWAHYCPNCGAKMEGEVDGDDQ